MQRIVLHLFAIIFVMATGTAFGQEQSLADQIMDTDEKQFIVIFPKLKEQAEQEVPVLIAEIEKKLAPDANQVDKEKLAKRLTNAAVVLLRLNQAEKVWSLLKHSPDPRARCYLIHRMGPLGVDPKVIINRINDETEVSIRRALILSLGEFDVSALSLESRMLLPKLQDIFRNDTDPGLHAASEWLLRKWQQNDWVKQVEEELARNDEQRNTRLDRIEKNLPKVESTPQWYVNSQGQTMVVIPGPVVFMMGSPKTESDRFENERQHKRRIGRTFSIASKLVTLEQYRTFDGEYTLPDEATKTVDLPVTNLSWYDAAEYCNWLSKEEGVPEEQWCFEITEADIKRKKNYLSLTGYRLPTEAEMEFATRAGASTARYYGETHELLRMYAWYENNSQKRTWPVGSLKPNDFGLFDTLGNVYTWCEGYSEYSMTKGEEAIADHEDDLVDNDKDLRALRGDSFLEDSSQIRSAFRNADEPLTSVVSIGFRVARTIQVVPGAAPSTP